jgi:transcriptional regulator with XRE-family HTH domain
MSDTTSIIKRLRAAGLSQSEISRRTGIPQPRLSRWEAGEVPDAADDALKLAKLDDLTEQPKPVKARARAKAEV